MFLMCHRRWSLKGEKELIKKKKSTKGVVFAKGSHPLRLFNFTNRGVLECAYSDANEATNVEQKGQLYAFLVGIMLSKV